MDVSVNNNKPDEWKKDILLSVDFYNSWFVEYAPEVYRNNRKALSQRVTSAMEITGDFSKITPAALKEHPETLSVLRMSMCPPLARDRLIGLSKVSKNLILSMENENESKIPSRMKDDHVNSELRSICQTFSGLLDRDLFPWLNEKRAPTEKERDRAVVVIADRLCGSVSDPIIRNAQEKRQLDSVEKWLEKRGYVRSEPGTRFGDLDKGTYSFRINAPVSIGEYVISTKESKSVNVPIDVVIMPKPSANNVPLLIEAKSAGDYTNVNKRRKEEAQKMGQLRRTYGEKMKYILFLCGYFDAGYLGYEAAEGIDWVWEHRIDDLRKFDL
jgi:hypothetical protein